MTLTATAPPEAGPAGLLSRPRIITLLSSLLVSLSSGTNYVYSAYAPQLGAQLHITHTQLNIIGLSGNVGVYVTAPLWGRIIDRRGPKIPLFLAFFLLLLGYSGIRHFYDIGIPDGTTQISTLTFGLLIACGFMTGAGGNGGFTGAVNSTAKSFPDRARASATGLVIGGFGLSAFFFSNIARYAFPGNTSSFLLLLALGTASPMILGFFFVKPIPLPLEDKGLEYNGSPDRYPNRNDSHTRLLDHVDSAEGDDDDTREQNGSAPVEHHSHASSKDDQPNVHGWRLARSPDFWLLFAILSILSGTGLMYINNVGSMSQALFAQGNPDYDEKEAAKWQASQVSYLSLMNFAGRIFIGLVSDLTKGRLGLPRSYCLLLVSFFFFTSQVAAANIDRIGSLWIASSIVGLSHGSTFSLLPTVCIEWFGLPHFSENWGYISLSPIIAGNVFSIIFGQNMDAHAEIPSEPSTDGALALVRVRAAASATDARHVCLQGRLCYAETLHLTAFACFVAMGLSVWAGWRDKKKLAALERGRGKLSEGEGEGEGEGLVPQRARARDGSREGGAWEDGE